MGHHRIAVVIPARDAARELPEQLLALAAEPEAGELHVVVVDDASTDGTGAVAASFRDVLPGIEVVRVEEGNIARVANAGVAVTDAELVLRLDADDAIAPGYVGAMDRALTLADLAAAALDFDHHLPPDRAPRPEQKLEPVLGYLPAHPTCALGFRRSAWELVGGFEPSVPRLADVDFCWRAQEAGLTIADAPGATLHYRLRSGRRAVARQHYLSGIEHPRLMRMHRSRGAPMPTIRRGLRRTWRTLRAVPVRSGPVARTEWIARASRQAGRAVGSVRARTWYL